MAPAKALAQLALQKRFLLAEAEAQRLVLASELQRVITPLRWADRLHTKAGPVLRVAAPVVAFWLTRRSKGLKRWVPAGFGVMRVIKALRKLPHRSGSH